MRYKNTSAAICTWSHSNRIWPPFDQFENVVVFFLATSRFGVARCGGLAGGTRVYTIAPLDIAMAGASCN